MKTAIMRQPSVTLGAPVREIHRLVLVAAGATAAVVAVIVILGVTPSARDIWVPRTTGSGGTLPALWISTIANLVFASLLMLAVVFRATRRTVMRRLVVVLAAGALVQALMFLDAAAAFSTGGAEMKQATSWVRYAALGDATAALLVLGSVVAKVRNAIARVLAALPGTSGSRRP